VLGLADVSLGSRGIPPSADRVLPKRNLRAIPRPDGAFQRRMPRHRRMGCRPPLPDGVL